MYDEITEAINNLKSLIESKTDGTNDRLDNVEAELKLHRKLTEAGVVGETTEDLIEDGEIEEEDTDVA